jgi:hypothetical protein
MKKEKKKKADLAQYQFILFSVWGYSNYQRWGKGLK